MNEELFSIFAHKLWKNKMKIGIIVAMDRELQQLRQVFDNSQVIVEKCGIGKVNAALGVQRMINEHRPDCIISSGCAGGNGEGVNIKDIVVSREVAYHDVYCGKAEDGSLQYGQMQGMPARFQADPYLLRKSEELTSYCSRGFAIPAPLTVQGDLQSPHLHHGLIVTGDWFVDSREKMQSIVDLFPEALAVDMESAAIAHACYVNKVPFISFRVVSDVPLRDSHASQYHDFWNQVAAQSFQLTRTFVESL